MLNTKAAAKNHRPPPSLPEMYTAEGSLCKTCDPYQMFVRGTNSPAQQKNFIWSKGATIHFPLQLYCS